VSSFSLSAIVSVAACFAVMAACDMFKTKYEDIPPTLPDLKSIVALDTVQLDFPLLNIDGEDVSLSDFQGKVLFINIWGMWCGPCIRELPGIQKLYDSVNDDRIAFLLLSNESIDTLNMFLEFNDYSFPVYQYTDPLPAALSVRSFPTTFIVDKDGNVVFRYNVTAKWDDPSVETFLTHLVRGE
jgi:thiol-disulfide isomerase/thioredoxin